MVDMETHLRAQSALWGESWGNRRTFFDSPLVLTFEQSENIATTHRLLDQACSWGVGMGSKCHCVCDATMPSTVASRRKPETKDLSWFTLCLVSGSWYVLHHYYIMTYIIVTYIPITDLWYPTLHIQTNAWKENKSTTSCISSTYWASGVLEGESGIQQCHQ